MNSWKNNITSILRIIFILISIPLFFLFTEIHIGSWIPIPFILVLGYFFGKITCDINIKTRVFWITVGIFSFINLSHSLIDGIGLVSIDGLWNGISAIIVHELIRQPILFVIIWAMLRPFQKSTKEKVFISIIAVTGMWALGLIFGGWGAKQLTHIQFVHEYMGYAMFIFLGDIFHHMIDDFKKISRHRH